MLQKFRQYHRILYWLNKPDDNAIATAASQVQFERAHVTEIIKDEAAVDTWTEGLRLGTQAIVVVLDGGDYKGQELQLYNFLSAYGNVGLKIGSNVVSAAQFSDYNSVAVYAKDSVKALVEQGYLSGSGNQIHPKEIATRAELAQLLYSLLKM